MIIAVIDTTLAVAKRKPEKNVQNPWTVVILVISMQIKAGNTLGAGDGTAIYGPHRYLLL